MKIDLKTLPPSGAVLREVEDPSIIDIQDEVARVIEPIRCEVEAYLSESLLLVKGKLSTRVRLVCCRCLEEFTETLSVPEFQAQIPVENREGTVDLTEKIREDIILAFPYKAICSPNCQGLCPKCGRNLSQGPCRCRPPASGGQFSQLNSLKIK